MYGNSVKKLKVKFIVCFVLSIILDIFTLILGINSMSLLEVLGQGLLMAVMFPFEFMSIVLNTKKIFLGLIRPIPILSFLLEYFVGIFMAFKAFIWLIKNWNNDAA